MSKQDGSISVRCGALHRFDHSIERFSRGVEPLRRPERDLVRARRLDDVAYAGRNQFEIIERLDLIARRLDRVPDAVGKAYA